MRWIRVLVVSVLVVSVLVVSALVGFFVVIGNVVALPSYSLEIAFGIDPRVEPAAGDWVDISQWLEEGSVNRGQSSELERFQAGTLNVTLDNEDRRFEPDYKESPYYPNVELDQHIRLRATQGAITYDIFRGFVSDWDTEWRLPNKARVSAIDAFRYFGTRSFLENPYPTEVLADSPVFYWDFNKDNAAEGVSVDRSGNGFNGTHIGGMSFEDVGSIGEDKAAFFAGPNSTTGPRVSAGSGPAISGTGAFSIEFLWRYDGSDGAGGRFFYQYDNGTGFGVTAYVFPVNASGTVNFSITEAAGSGSVAGNVVVQDGNWHHIVLVREAGGTLRIYVDGVLDNSAAATSRNVVAREVQVGGLPAGGAIRGFIDEVAVYHSALSAARVAAHYEAHGAWAGDLSGTRIERVLDYIDWPAGLRDIDTGDTVLQGVGDVAGESSLEHMQRVEASEFGGFYMTGAGKTRFRERSALSSTAQVTIGRDVGQLPYVEIKPDRNESQLRNEVRFTRVGGLEQVASISNRFFNRTFSRGDLMNTTDDEVRTLAAAVLGRYQVPLTDYTVTLNPRADDALWAEVFGRELEDAVMVSRIPPLASTSQQFIWDTSEWDEDTRWGSAISGAMRILGIKHDFGKGFTWKTTWKVSPV